MKDGLEYYEGGGVFVLIHVTEGLLIQYLDYFIYTFLPESKS